jgi:hypothetical protein
MSADTMNVLMLVARQEVILTKAREHGPVDEELVTLR